MNNKYLISKNLGILILSLFIFSVKVMAQERVTVRSDRNIYFGGEKIWLAVNCFETNSNKQSKASKLVYLELLNQGKEIILSNRVNLEAGAGSIIIDIPDTLATGNYAIRAYTNWMLNSNPDLYCSQNISIINPFSKHKFPKKESLFFNDTALLFIEGNQLLADTDNSILIHISDKYGNGKASTGQIITDSNEQIKSFKTNKNGFVNFELNPNASQSYKLIFGADSIDIPLPKAVESGTVIHLEEPENSNLSFRIRSNKNNISSEKGSIHILSAEGKFLSKKEIQLKNNQFVGFSSNELPQGILCALLLDSENEIISSRYFSPIIKSHNDSLKIQLNKTNFIEREKVDLSIYAPKQMKHISIAVVKTSLAQLKNTSTKLTALSSIHGHSSFTKSSLRLNHFLLTKSPIHTYTQGQMPPTHFPEPYFKLVEGKLINTGSNKPVANEKLILSFISDNPDILVATTDSEGNFIFEVEQKNTREMIIQPFSHRSHFYNYTIDFKNQNKLESPTLINPLAIDANHMDELNQCIINAQIMAWFNIGQATNKTNTKAKSFYGEPSYEIPIEKFIELPTMEEVIREIVPATHVRIKDGNYHLKIYGEKVSNSDSILVLVDGVPIWNQNLVFSITPSDVNKIEVLNADYFVSGVNLGPIISISTNNANLSTLEFDKNIFRIVKKGDAKTWQFNNIKYPNDSIRNSRMPDFRNTLYWNPEVTNFIDKKSTVSFYTADEKCDYSVIVEGIDKYGTIRRSTTILSVE